MYRQLAEDYLAIPVFTGLKTESEKFAGAEKTYCIEAMMRDKRALQAGTSHNLGQNFSKAFGVTFQTEHNQEEFVWATSWGVSTRLVGAVILAHGDKKGLRIPPRIAPVQVVIVPIVRDNDQSSDVQKYLEPIINGFAETGVRYHIDWTDNSPGFKFNEWEMKGVPLRMEVGPRDMAEGNVILARRDMDKKISFSCENVNEKIPTILEKIQQSLYAQALAFRNENIHTTNSYDELKKIINEGGFVRCGWDGLDKTETAVKEETKATIRCIPFDEQPKDLTCVYSGKPAKHEVIYAKAY